MDDRSRIKPALSAKRRPVDRLHLKRPMGVQARLLALEERVARLEKELERIRPPAPPKPPAVRTGPRCPGCHLPVDSIARGRCPWCGFVFDVLADLKRARRRRARASRERG